MISHSKVIAMATDLGNWPWTNVRPYLTQMVVLLDQCISDPATPLGELEPLRRVRDLLQARLNSRR